MKVIGTLMLAWLVSIPAANADIRSATGKPLVDFYTVKGALDSVRAIKDVCNARYPSLAKRNESAYEDWQIRYKAFRYKIENYDEEITKKVSKQYDPAKRYREDALRFEQQKKQQHEFFLGAGEASYRQTCENYPGYLRSEKANFAVYMAEHMRVFEAYWAAK